MPTSFENFSDWRRGSDSFESISGYAFDTFNLTGGRSPEQLRAARVAVGFFDVLGVKPLLGRTFYAMEGGPSPARVVVLSERLWNCLLAVVVLIVPAIWATAIPAMRAARTDPAQVLRRA